MRPQELQPFLDETLSFPIDLRAVREQVGGVGLDAPDEADTRTIGAVLEQLDDETYASATELAETIVANLPDAYVGRKYYSDRGGHVEAHVDGWSTGPDQSL